MRQRLQKYLPIFLIALAVQILAPIAGSWAAAIAASNPLAAEICHSDGSPAASPDQGTGQHKTAGSSCAICCLAQAGGSIDAPKLFGVPIPQWSSSTIVWHEQVARAGYPHAGSNAQARAPPVLS